MSRVEISALVANLRAKERPSGTLERAAAELERVGQRELALAVTQASRPDPLTKLSVDLIQDLLERIATLEDQRG